MSNIASHAPESVSSSSVMDKTVIPVDKVEHAGSMSQDERHGVVPRANPFHEDKEPRWNRIREYAGDFFSEFFATMVMILFGDGVVAQVVLSENTKGDYQSISWGWG